MIVVWGASFDGATATVVDALRDAGAEHLFLDQVAQRDGSGPASSLELTVVDGVTGTLTFGNDVVDVGDVTAMYLRPYDLGRTLAGKGTDPETSERQFERLLWMWADVTPALVINRPAAMASNGSKPFQGEQIRRAGFLTPPTLLTTDPAVVEWFWSAHGNVVYKSISGTRSVVSRLDDSHRERLPNVAVCPVQFQVLVPGADVRVHVVGDQVFAVEVTSDADDYRYAARQGATTHVRPTRISGDFARRCRSLARQQGLIVAGIDLRQGPDGDWCCFEINPAPAFSVFDDGDRAIAKAVARLLADPPPTGVDTGAVVER